MRALVATCALWFAAAPARAESLPPGSIGLVGALASGTFADASRLGYGYQLGAQAAYQPMRTENRLGFSLKWSFVFGTMYSADSARVGNELLTFQMDLMAGLRIRPGVSATRYLTVRVGPQLMRTNQVIPTMSMDEEPQRAFIGAVASVGVDWYAGIPWLGGRFVYSLEARLCQIDIPGVRSSPSTLAIMLGIGKTGP
jgi:hypothetical protein